MIRRPFPLDARGGSLSVLRRDWPGYVASPVLPDLPEARTWQFLAFATTNDDTWEDLQVIRNQMLVDEGAMS